MLARLSCVLLLVLATTAAAPAQGLFSWFGDGEEAAPGTKEWWEDHEDKAVFEPGKGFRVEGFEGYYDGQGRPIAAPVDEVFEDFSGQEKRSGLIPGLDPRIGYRKAKAAMGLGPNQQAAKDFLAEGERLVAAKKWADAEQPLENAIDRWPKSAVSNRAQFLLGECYFWQDQLPDAKDAYEKVVAEQPNSKELDTIVVRLWAIAKYWEKYHFEYKAEPTLQPNFMDKARPMFDTVGHSIKAYEAIRLNDPTGPLADDAIMAVAGIYFRRQRYQDADYQYELLRTEYPRSDHQFDAHILGLQSKLRKYMGPDYDGSPLKEAKQLLSQIRTQFSGRLTPEEKERLRQVEAEVRLAVEKRDIRLGEYYENVEQYGAARRVYDRVAKDHRGSPVAEHAQSRIAALSGKPAEPPVKLARMVELFPQNRERSRVAGVQEIPDPSATRLATNPDAASGGVVPASATTTQR